MIVALSATPQQKTAEDIAKALNDAFKGQVPLYLHDASAPAPWPSEANWDDLLLVIYDGTPFPGTGNDFIASYLADRGGKGLVLPIAIDLAHAKPPQPLEAIKAFPFGVTNAAILQRLTWRIGAMIGLRVLHRGSQVFISYRASDGTGVAQQLEQRLKDDGYPVWRDEAKEIDGETKILPGTAVQQQIDKGLFDATIVLLLDTPQAPHSPWIKHEVDTANGLLVPILPICLREIRDPNKGPRFRSLRDLQRWVDVSMTNPLSDAEVDRIVDSMETYFCELFQRKCRVPFIVEKEFVSRDFSWKILDQRRLMCESIKKTSYRLSTRVLSHCSVFEQVRGVTMKAFSAFLKENGKGNHSLYIYSGELIPEPELKEIVESAPADDGVVILHHQELAALIDSNFTTFTP